MSYTSRERTQLHIAITGAPPDVTHCDELSLQPSIILHAVNNGLSLTITGHYVSVTGIGELGRGVVTPYDDIVD